MQTLIIAGTIGKDAELRTTQKGEKVAGFSVAVSNGKDANGNYRDSTWYDCSLWGKRAESMAGMLAKGGKVTVTGRPTVRVHNDKAYLGLSVDQITLQGGKQSQEQDGYNEQPGHAYDQSPSGPQNDAGGYGGAGAGPTSRDLDDEIPFAMEWRG